MNRSAIYFFAFFFRVVLSRDLMVVAHSDDRLHSPFMVHLHIKSLSSVIRDE